MITPARISPTTAGWCRRSNSSASTFAAAVIRNSVTKMSIPCPEPRASSMTAIVPWMERNGYQKRFVLFLTRSLPGSCQKLRLCRR